MNSTRSSPVKAARYCGTSSLHCPFTKVPHQVNPLSLDEALDRLDEPLTHRGNHHGPRDPDARTASSRSTTPPPVCSDGT